MKPFHIMDTNGARIFVRTLAKASNLTVVFHEEAITPHTDAVKGTIHVARPKWSFTEEEHLCWQGEILHELGHHRGNNGTAMQYFVAKRLDTKTLYGTVVNILLDWVNDFQWTRYDGAREALTACQRRCARMGIELIRDMPPSTKNSEKLSRIFSWIYNQRYLTYQRGLIEALEWEHLVPYEDQYGMYNSELRELLNSQTGEAIEALAIKIVPPPKKDDEEQEESENADSEDSDGESENAETEEKESGTEREVFISYRDLLLSDDHGTEGGKNKARIVYDHDRSENYEEFNDYQEIDLSEGV